MGTEQVLLGGGDGCDRGISEINGKTFLGKGEHN